MNKAVIIGVIVLLGVGAWFVMRPAGSTITTPTTSGVMEQKAGEGNVQNSVELKDFSFNPKTLTVKKGSTVTFTNNDLAGHTVTADDKSFESEIMNQGESTTVTFDTTGTFGFHCTPHPNMTFTVTVE